MALARLHAEQARVSMERDQARRVLGQCWGWWPAPSDGLIRIGRHTSCADRDKRRPKLDPCSTEAASSAHTPPVRLSEHTVDTNSRSWAAEKS